MGSVSASSPYGSPSGIQPAGTCPTGAWSCISEGDCILADSCGGPEYVWAPSTDLPPIATNIVTVDTHGNFLSSTIECNSVAFSASYPTATGSPVTQQLGPSCDLEIVAYGSTMLVRLLVASYRESTADSFAAQKQLRLEVPLILATAASMPSMYR